MKTATKVPEQVGFHFDAVEHVYTLEGKPLNGVTTILGVIAKPMLIQWAANMACDYVTNELLQEGFRNPELDVYGYTPAHLESVIKQARTAHRKKKEDAGTKGTEVHFEIEKYIQGCLEINEGKAVKVETPFKQVENFISWAVENNVKFLASEKRMYSREMWTAGTADIVCEIDGKLYVGDVKTSSGIYPEHFIQASAYAAMLTEMEAYKDFHGVIILNCRKDGGFEHKFNYDLEGNLSCFKAALTLYRHLNSLK